MTAQFFITNMFNIFELLIQKNIEIWLIIPQIIKKKIQTKQSGVKFIKM